MGYVPAGREPPGARGRAVARLHDPHPSDLRLRRRSRSDLLRQALTATVPRAPAGASHSPAPCVAGVCRDRRRYSAQATTSAYLHAL